MSYGACHEFASIYIKADIFCLMKHTPAILKQLHAYIASRTIRFCFAGRRGIAITGERRTAVSSLENRSAGRIDFPFKILVPVDGASRGSVESTDGFVIETPAAVAGSLISVLNAGTSVLNAGRIDREVNSPDTKTNSPVLNADAVDRAAKGFVYNDKSSVSKAAGIVSKAVHFVPEAGGSVYETSIVNTGTSFSDIMFTSLDTENEVFVISTSTLAYDADGTDPKTNRFGKAKSVFVRLRNIVALVSQRIVACVADYVDTLCMSVYSYEDTVYVFDTTGRAEYISSGKRRLIFVDTKDISELRKQLKKQQEADRLLELYNIFRLDCLVPIQKKPIQRVFWQIRSYKICYRYLPDQRIYTFRLLGKPSAGPSPPAMLALQSAA